MSTASGSSSRSAARRLIKELETWRVEAQDEKGIERLGPLGEEDLLVWEAVFNGRGIRGGYEGKSRLLLTSRISPIETFNLSPP
jgi:peroxin-4